MSKLVFWPVLIGVSTTVLLVLWRDFFWQHALIIGIGAAALIYSSMRTIQRLKDIHRPPE